MRQWVGFELDHRVVHHLDAQWTTGLMDAERVEQAIIGALMASLESLADSDELHAKLEELSGSVHQWHEDHPVARQYIQSSLA